MLGHVVKKMYLVYHKQETVNGLLFQKILKSVKHCASSLR